MGSTTVTFKLQVYQIPTGQKAIYPFSAALTKLADSQLSLARARQVIDEEWPNSIFLGTT